MSEDTHYLYGTQYFRPPNPPRHEHRFHLQKIKHELRFDFVRLRLQWNAIAHKPGVFDWSEYDLIADICDDIGLSYLLETNLESAPYWLERAHPQARYVSANGQIIELGPYDSTQFGGYPGLCFHHAEIQREGECFLTALIEHFKERPRLAGYDCWNEPHLEPAWICNYWGNMGDRLFCYCPRTRAAFRQWLGTRYETIEQLNVTWGRAYGEWDDINPPNRHGTYADWLDWGRFWFAWLQGHMQWRYRIIKQVDPSRFVMSHSGAVPPFLPRANAFIHNWKLAESVDMWGTSFAPTYHNWKLDACAGTIDATRSAARGKRFWISEMSGGSTYVRGFSKTPLPRPQDFRTWNWLAAAYGAKATCHWCYLEESTGPEAGSFGLIRANGQTTERAAAAGHTAALLRDYSNIVIAHQPRPQVGVLFDPDNCTQLFAMEGGDDLYTRSHVGFYRAIWESDNCARYITHATLDDLQDIHVLLLPMCLTLPSSLTKAIADYVRNGGVLVAEARTGLFDERGYNRAALPAGMLQEVVGAIELEALCSDPENRPAFNNPHCTGWSDEIYNGPTIHVCEPVRTEFRARGYLVPLEVTTGTPIATCQDRCVGVRNQYGVGTAYYFGTYMGLDEAQNEDRSSSVLGAILDRHTRPDVRGQNLRPRLIAGGERALLAVFNTDRDRAHEEQLTLRLPCETALDIYSGERYSVDAGKLGVVVGPDDAKVLLLT